MNYRLLGNSGLRVSEVALGTMTFGTDWGWGADLDEAQKIYEAFRSAGGNFVDTASIYTNGSSETIVAMGILTGKYGRRNGRKAVSGRGEKMELHQFSNCAIEIGDVVVEIADKLRHEPAEVAINWLRYKQTIPLLGASQAGQM